MQVGHVKEWEVFQRGNRFPKSNHDKTKKRVNVNNVLIHTYALIKIGGVREVRGGVTSSG